LTRLRLDALPTSQQAVMINYAAPALGAGGLWRSASPSPIEAAISGLAGNRKHAILLAQWLRPGDCDFPRRRQSVLQWRQQVAERLAQAKPNLPPASNHSSDLCPQALGEIFMYSVEYANPGGDGARVGNGAPGWQSDGSYLADDGERLSDDIARLAYLRTVQDWILRPQLKTVPGVADIDSLGGYEKQYIVEPDAAELAHY